MKNNNFLLSILGGGDKPAIKGKNPNPSGKIITSSTANFKKKDSKVEIEQNKDENTKKSEIKKQIEKLEKKLQQTNNQIQDTQKKLDVDLFLKKQKQKRQQYAKNLNNQYELQKKLRQQKLYKKYNRKGKNNQDQNQQNDQNLNQTKNVTSNFPLQFIKLLQNQKNSISKTASVINGHFTIKDLLNNQNKKKELFDYEKITKQQNQLLFVNLSQSQLTYSLKKIAENMLDIKYFPIQFQSSSLEPIEQYQNIINALSLMPTYLSQKYYNFQQIDNKHFFLCKMFFNGQRKSILTNDFIQTRQFAHRHLNIMSKVNGNRNFGPTLIQKCYRKVSANYQNIQLKDSIYTLYGIDAQIIPISNKNYIKQNFQTIIKFLINSEQILAFMNDNDHNKSIYQNRLYKLKQVIVNVEFSKDQQIQIKKKKNKKDKKQQQIQELHKQKSFKTLYHLQNPWKGLILDTKGTNKFQLLQLLQKFNKLILIRDYPKSFVCKRINFQLFSTGPLSITSNQWTKNNQYNFSLNVQMTIRVIMRKKLISNAQSILKKDIQNELDYENKNLFGFMIFSLKEGQQKVTCLKMQSLICKTKSNDQIQGVSFCSSLVKGNYIIIPYSNKVTKNSFQPFYLDFFVEKQECINFGKAIINQWKWNGYNGDIENKDYKIIQSLQSKQIIKKTIVQNVQMNKISPQEISIQKMLKNLQQQKIILSKGLKFNDILIPGKMNKFLVNPEVEIKQKSNFKSKGNKKSDKNNNKKSKNDQAQAYMKQEALKVMLGYDILQGQDIDRGLMMQYMQQNQDVLDFQNYGLGKQGLTAIMQTLMLYPSIVKLNLSYNDLDVKYIPQTFQDSCIVFLCYYLQKANRVQLRQLNITNNPFNKIGIKAVKGLLAKFTNLNVLY